MYRLYIETTDKFVFNRCLVDHTYATSVSQKMVKNIN